MTTDADRPNLSNPAAGERPGAQTGSGISPVWHKNVLTERLRRLDNGNEPTSSWAEAKERIRARIRAGRRGAASTIE